MKNVVKSIQVILFAGLAFGAVGCSSVPDAPERPAVPEISNYDMVGAFDTASTEVVVNWWETFEDPLLTALIEEALARNTRLEVAQANVATAIALADAQALGRTPSLTSTAAADIGLPPRDGADLEFTGSGRLNAAWEYDAFGRIEALIQSAEFNVEAAEEARRDVAVIVAAATAQAYTDLKGAQVRLDVAQRNAQLQSESLELLDVLLENGRANELDLSRARSQYRTTLASLPRLEAEKLTAASRLAALTGHTSRADAPLVAEALTSPAIIPEPAVLPAIGTPADLIRMRPDIRLAEANIARQLVLGEAERARLFPTITFNAGILALVTESLSGGEGFAFNQSGLGFNIGPALQWDGPDLRRVRADIDIADAQTIAAYKAYTDTVITALQEVDAAMINLVKERSRRADLQAAAQSAERATEIARLRFEEGIDDSLDVIDAQRTLLNTQDTLQQSKLEATNRVIALYQALGGIWDTAELNASSSERD